MMSGPPATRTAGRLRWWREVLYILAFYSVYTFIRNRGVATDSVATARRNAFEVIDLERRLGAFWEEGIQERFLHWEGFIQFWNIFYGTAHFVVTIFALVYLFRRMAHRYPLWRNTLACTTGLALIGFAFYPLMPPRLLDSGFGFVDTLRDIGGLWSFESGAVAKVSNQYAAMPSLHFAWSTWCALVLLPAVRRPAVRLLVVAYPAMTLFAIVVTANHYWLDAAGGAATLGAGFLLGRALTRALEARGRQPLPETVDATATVTAEPPATVDGDLAAVPAGAAAAGTAAAGAPEPATGGDVEAGTAAAGVPEPVRAAAAEAVTAGAPSGPEPARATEGEAVAPGAAGDPEPGRADEGEAVSASAGHAKPVRAAAAEAVTAGAAGDPEPVPADEGAAVPAAAGDPEPVRTDDAEAVAAGASSGPEPVEAGEGEVAAAAGGPEPVEAGEGEVAAAAAGPEPVEAGKVTAAPAGPRPVEAGEGEVPAAAAAAAAVGGAAGRTGVGRAVRIRWRRRRARLRRRGASSPPPARDEPAGTVPTDAVIVAIRANGTVPAPGDGRPERTGVAEA